MTVYNVKKVMLSDVDELLLKCVRALGLQSILASFYSLYCFYSTQNYCFSVVQVLQLYFQAGGRRKGNISNK